MMRAGLSHRRAIIVGAGQAGLAVAAALIAEGLQPQQDFVVIDQNSDRRRSWDSRWHSMLLLSSARDSALPLRPLPGDQGRHPRVDEIVGHLTEVESALGVETIWGIRATGVQHRGTGTTLLLATTAGEVQTRNIVCATGAAAHPQMPDWVQKLTVPGVVMHSSSYLYPRQIPDGDVLIVGGGNSGVQLAQELAASHTVTLAVRSPRPYRPANKYHSAGGERVGLLSRRKKPEPLFGTGYPQLRNLGVTIAPGVIDAEGHTVSFADGTRTTPGTVILATGFSPGDDWLPTVARADRPRQTQTGLPGLVVAGMPQYSRRGVDTLVGVWQDARIIARHIIDRP